MTGTTEKGVLFRALKDAGVHLEKHYREFSLPELRGLAQNAGLTVQVPAPVAQAPEPRQDQLAEIKAELGGLTSVLTQLVQLQMAQQPPAPAPAAAPAQAPQPGPRPPAPEPKPAPAGLDPAQHAGVTLNTHAHDEPIEVDAQGRQWYQKEVAKPGYAKPRGRRILRDMDPGTKVQTITTPDGLYTESFEIPGDPSHARPIEIKVTLPSYQTGIYREPGMPFKIHTYNGARGFDWDDVNNFYGASDLVPDTIKKVYVSSDLCYDITTTVRAIQDEYRERVLKRESIR